VTKGTWMKKEEGMVKGKEEKFYKSLLLSFVSSLPACLPASQPSTRRRKQEGRNLFNDKSGVSQRIINERNVFRIVEHERFLNNLNDFRTNVTISRPGPVEMAEMRLTSRFGERIIR
jgi:hypothetical protein